MRHLDDNSGAQDTTGRFTRVACCVGLALTGAICVVLGVSQILAGGFESVCFGLFCLTWAPGAFRMSLFHARRL